MLHKICTDLYVENLRSLLDLTNELRTSLDDIQNDRINFSNKKALFINNCPYVELSEFDFENRIDNNIFSLNMSLSWLNTGNQPIIAFEIVVLKYDPFNRRIAGSSILVPGRNSADWRPLEPGQSSNDVTKKSGIEYVFTAIAYVRHVRLNDGSIWKVDNTSLLEQLRTIESGINEFSEFDLGIGAQHY